MRVSIGPGEVAGYLGQLAEGFRAIGVPCEHFLYIPPHQFSYPVPAYFLSGVYDRVAKLRKRGRLGQLAAAVGDKAIRAVGLLYAILRYDVFIFSGYGSFFRFAELPLLRLLGKRVIVIYLGSDARPPYLSGKHIDDASGVFNATRVSQEARQIARRFAWVERFASVIVNHTGTAQFAKRKFVRLCALRLPMKLRREPAGLHSEGRGDINAQGIRILHAPSRPFGKGTPQIRAAVELLRSEGFDIEFTELKGVSNDEVLRHIARCDLVVDELYSDAPMATFAAEAAMLAKPAVVGSLYAADFARDNPDTMPPTFFIDPDELVVTMRSILTDPALGKAVGAAAKRFVEEESTPAAVARRYYKIAVDDIPVGWIADPCDMAYVGGWGLSRANWQRQVQAFVDDVGTEGLGLSRRPDLERSIIRSIWEKTAL